MAEWKCLLGDKLGMSKLSVCATPPTPMDTPKPLRIAIVGLGFGAEFIPIYQAHPDAELSAICQRNETKLNAIGEAFEIKKR